MSYIRTHFLLLEWISFMLWGIATGLTICVVVLLTSHDLRNLPERLRLVLIFGPLLGSIFWFGWRINMRRLWTMQKSEFDRLFFSVCSLGLLPLSLLLLDLNARHVLSRLYCGPKPIPYTFFNPLPVANVSRDIAA